MIRLEQVSKSYGQRRALTGVTLAIAGGERVGLVGPAGSGRTTLLRAIGTLIAPSAGQVTVDGVDNRHDPFAVRRKVFLAGDGPRRTAMTVSEHLLLIGGARGGRRDRVRVEAVAARAGLPGDAVVNELGEREQRMFGLASAALSDAPVLLLDELFADATGEDRAAARDLLAEAHARGATLVATALSETHLQGVCDRVAHLSEGRVRA